jgi:hypothetical protein
MRHAKPRCSGGLQRHPAAPPPVVRKGFEAVKKSSCRGGPCGRPGATIPRLRDTYDAPPKRDFFTASSPFRKMCVLNILLRTGWKARPSSLCGGGRRFGQWTESRRLSARRGGRAALSTV